MEGLRKFGRNDIEDQTIQALWDVQEHTLGYLPNLSQILAASPEVYKGIFSIARMAFIAGLVSPRKKLLVRLSRSVAHGNHNDIVRAISHCLKSAIPEDLIHAIVNDCKRFPYDKEDKYLIEFAKLIFSAPSAKVSASIDNLLQTLSTGQIVELVLATTVHDMVSDLNRICGTKLEDEISEIVGSRFFGADFKPRSQTDTISERLIFTDSPEPMVPLAAYDSLTNQSQRGFWNLFVRKLGFMPNFLKLALQWPDFLTQHMNITHSIIEMGEVPRQVKVATSMIVAKATGDINKQIRLFRLSKLQGIAPSRLVALYDYNASKLFSTAEKVMFKFCERYSSSFEYPRDTDFTALRRYFTSTQIVETISAVCYFLYIQRVETILGCRLEFSLDSFLEEFPMARGLVMQQRFVYPASALSTTP